jgi:hypothetical protein
VTPATASRPRSESVLWLQLLGLGVMPLEALLLLLLLAGSDPGPWPALERLLCWAIGSLVPAYLLWRRPADPFSLLLLQVPQRGRSRLQLQLSALQATPLLQAGLLLGCLASLALLWWVDVHAAVATALSPLGGSSRLLALLEAAVILALLLWQWQQLLQALWLLRCPPERLAATAPMGLETLNNQRLLLGIPLLLPSPLQPSTPPPSPTRTDPAPAEPSAMTQVQPIPLERPEAVPQPQAQPPARSQTGEEPEVQPPHDPSLLSAPPTPPPFAGRSGDVAAVAVEPEQAAADDQGGGLDQQIR